MFNLVCFVLGHKVSGWTDYTRDGELYSRRIWFTHCPRCGKATNLPTELTHQPRPKST